jgi:hypothetical protein
MVMNKTLIIKICAIVIIIVLYIILAHPIFIQYKTRIVKTTKRKVFCIGLGRTATSSLTSALIHLGYRTWHCPILYDTKNFHNYVNQFDALTELPFCCSYTYKDLHEAYPDALFILTVRDSRKWLKSTEKYKKLVNNMAVYSPGYEMFCENFNNYDFSIESFNLYNQQVINYFRYTKSRLLTLNIPNGDGWAKLCNFLGEDIPNKPFPNVKEINLQLRLRFKYLFN